MQYLSEADNNVDLNGGEMGLEYRIYYREMVARFSYHLGWRYNIGEEPTMSNDEVKNAAAVLRNLDPYRHPIGSHCSHKIADFTEMYNSLLGLDYFDGAWMQLHRNHDTEIANWRSKSAAHGHKWVVGNDESWAIELNNLERAEAYYWKTIMAGGEGMTQYLGYDLKDASDITIEDFRKTEATQKTMINARRLLSMPEINKHLPAITSEDGLIGNGGSDDPPFCFAKKGELYVVYRRKSGDIRLDLSDQPGDYAVKWYDPRKGGALKEGSVKKVTGGGTVWLGQAPSDNAKSWAVLVTLSPCVLAQNLALALGRVSTKPTDINTVWVEQRSNILFCIMDDASWPHMSTYGCSWIKTPAFDRLAEEYGYSRVSAWNFYERFMKGKFSPADTGRVNPTDYEKARIR